MVVQSPYKIFVDFQDGSFGDLVWPGKKVDSVMKGAGFEDNVVDSWHRKTKQNKNNATE